MRYIALLIVLASASGQLAADEPQPVADGFNVEKTDWPWWRGPHRNGTADPEQSPPIEFSEQKNVVWKTPISGRGYGSPTLFGDRLYLATGDETSGSQMVLCFDRNTGQQLWRTVVHKSGGMMKNKRATLASCSLACDGERVFVNFPNSNALITTALSTDGEQLWQQRISSYVVHQGFGSSPALYQDLVIVSSDNKGGGAIAALRRTSGAVAWKRDRPSKPNYPSPILIHSQGQDQLIMVGCDQIVSYQPLTGDTIWQTSGATTECVTSTLTDGNLVFTSGGYPKNHMSAVRADGSGEVVWENGSRLYVPSMVIRDGYLYGVLDAGIATCWKASSGQEMWKSRLEGDFTSSPVLVGDKVFVSSEDGTFYVFLASPDGFELLAKNKLGDEVFATPTIVGGRIYHRVAHRSPTGDRNEVLYCVGK